MNVGSWLFVGKELVVGYVEGWREGPRLVDGELLGQSGKVGRCEIDGKGEGSRDTLGAPVGYPLGISDGW